MPPDPPQYEMISEDEQGERHRRMLKSIAEIVGQTMQEGQLHVMGGSGEWIVRAEGVYQGASLTLSASGDTLENALNKLVATLDHAGVARFAVSAADSPMFGSHAPGFGRKGRSGS